MHVSIYNLFKYKYLQNYNIKNSIYLTQSFHFIMIVLPKFKKIYCDFLLLQEFHNWTDKYFYNKILFVYF